jgi:hypothetical protein
MLRHEISLLTDEITSLTTKMRANQELVPELRKTIASLEKREKAAVTELRDFKAKEAETTERLQV